MATDTQSGSSNATLEARIAVLEDLFVRLAQNGGAENILDDGLKTIAERLDTIAGHLLPLFALVPEVPPLTQDQALRVRNLTAALVSPDWTAIPPPVQQGAIAGVQATGSAP